MASEIQKNIHFKKPLIVGTGGGNDIVSASFIMYDFISSGIRADLAGVCSPGASHIYASVQEEQAVNIVDENAVRYIPSKLQSQIPFIDSRIPDLLRQNGISSRVYNLSGRFGTTRLIESLNQLVKSEGYDGILAVDVGGDILARGKEDPTILSPLMDFTTLFVLSQLNVPTKLLEFGLQTDGELRPKGCEEILADLTGNGILENKFDIRKNPTAIEFFKRIYNGISSIRHGHTAHMTLQTFEASEDINTLYRTRVQVFDKKWFHHFPLTLESKYFGKAFVIDLKSLASKRKLAFPYRNALEQFIKTKQIVDIKTEMDSLYYSLNGSCIWLGLICPQMEGLEREEAIAYGINNLEKHADVALLWSNDVRRFEDMKTREVGSFALLGRDLCRLEEVAGEVAKYI